MISMIPDSIISKIMLYNSHPIADLLKASWELKGLPIKECIALGAKAYSFTNIRQEEFKKKGKLKIYT